MSARTPRAGSSAIFAEEKYIACPCRRNHAARIGYRRPTQFRIIAIGERALAGTFPQDPQVDDAEDDLNRSQRSERHAQRDAGRPQRREELFARDEMPHSKPESPANINFSRR